MEEETIRCPDRTYEDEPTWIVPSWEKVMLRKTHTENAVLPVLIDRYKSEDELRALAAREIGRADELRQEETRERTIKLGKWAKDVCDLVVQIGVYATVWIGRTMKVRLDHVSFWTQKRRGDREP